jgi:hypothetical protein
MKRFALAIVLTSAAGCAMAPPVAERSAEAQQRLAEQLADRVAEPSVACVMQRDLRGNTPIDERTILFNGPGSLVYVNELRTPCAGLRPWHALRIRTTGTNLCEGELVVAFDPTSGVEYGGCSLGRFTPYRRVG